MEKVTINGSQKPKAAEHCPIFEVCSNEK